MVDNTDKLEEAGTPYVQRVTLVPLVRPGVRAGPQSRQGHLCVVVTQDVYSVRLIVLHLKKGYNECCVGGAILLQIDKQRVRVFKLIIFKLTLCSIAKLELLVMQYEHDMKAHVHIQSNINKHIKQLH